jgi:hypothetical protein
MAKNYTTKTSALKATTIDVRNIEATGTIDATNVEADSLKVGGKDIMEAIEEASDAAAAAAGIVVERDLNQDYDSADAEEVIATKIQNMKFFGEYVNVVDNKDGSVSLYFGKNNNPAEFSTVTAPAGDAMYTYVDNGSDYVLGAAPAGNGNTYAHCQSGGSETVYAGSSSTVITIPNKTSKVKVEAVDNSGNTIASAETAVIDGSQGTVTATNAGITINVTNIHLNTSDDAADGMTPGFIRCKVSATLTNATIMPKGGFYKVKMTVAGKSNTNGTGMFIYTSPTVDPSIEGVTATYASTGTKTVSGITYDNGAKVTVNVTGIKNTQWMATKNTNRITVSDNSNGRLADIGAVAVSSLTAANSTDKTKKNAEFSYSKEVTFTASHDPAVMSGSYTATPYKPLDGSALSSAAKSGSFAGSRYLWNGAEGTENDATSSFHVDGKRLAYTVLTDASGNVTGLDLDTTAAYDSAKLLTTDYPQQLLVQGGYLKHPGGANMDVTKTYNSTNCTGTRYWTKLIKTGSSADAKTTFTITGSGFTGSGVKIWAVCSNTDATATAGAKSLLINALGSAGGFAKSVSNTSLSVEIPGGQMTCKQNSCFYLVVQVPAASTVKLGAITVK